MNKTKKVNRKNIVWWQMRRFFVTTIIGGLAVILPVTIFVLLIRLLLQVITAILAPVSGLFDFIGDAAQWLVPFLSFIIIIVVFFLVGLFVRTNLGENFFKNLEERWLIQLPFYRVIRDTVRQLVGVEKMPFSQVVLADVFANGIWMTGFVTDEHPNDYYTIFVPTSPNPTNGFVFHIHASKLKFLEAKSEDAMSAIIGLGIGSKVLFAAKEKDKLVNLPDPPADAPAP
ncbi:MAG TPA: DUF502 domain-containing protein [Saprospiraceae bacterium]|nr:DUF502 domain-containing protein [Saprospiraceae bacterium]HMP23124.1 DUF502 domain-containing protein [Saprospiraceae bacterium]